jgi:hypothetical protein
MGGSVIMNLKYCLLCFLTYSKVVSFRDIKMGLIVQDWLMYGRIFCFLLFAVSLMNVFREKVD